MANRKKQDSFDKALQKTEKELKDLAYARLEATGRECDGCGNRIGRWTDNCFYDSVHDRAYCSVEGCAEHVMAVGACASCGINLNPFFPDEYQTVRLKGRPTSFCQQCQEKHRDDELEYPKVNPDEVAGLSSKIRTGVKAGPYAVIQMRPAFYQVVLPVGFGAVSVRSTSTSVERAMKLCSDFNNDEFVPSWEGGDLPEEKPIEVVHEKRVQVEKNDPWLFIELKKINEDDVPTSWTRDKKGRIKTRLGTNRADQIIKWFESRGITINV